MRLCTLAFRPRLKHAALWWGASALVVIWPLWRPCPSRPYWSLTLPRSSGGTLAVRLGGLLFVWGAR